MRLLVSALLLALVQLSVGKRVRPANPAAVRGKRHTSLLANIKGFGALPPPRPHKAIAGRQSTTSSLNLDDIQGDILIGMRKTVELFYFFGIANATAFKPLLASYVAPIVTTTNQILSVSTQPNCSLNIAFSQTGLTALGVTDNVGDPQFSTGMAAISNTFLSDPQGTDHWEDAFKGSSIHGVFLLASTDSATINAQVASIEDAFGASMVNLYTMQGAVRPSPYTGHEMFGYLDGVGQPSVSGFNSPNPGQQVVQPGVILTGVDGDTQTRPSWMTGGSFLAFRKLQQFVPEWNKYLLDNAPDVPGQNFTLQEKATLLGARMVGRWKSGTPVDLAPLADDPTIGADPTLNNNFDFTHPNSNISTDQSYCPFTAHIRKNRPRGDLDTPVNAIIRAGIPYGPEVSGDENSSNTTSTDRGLAFVCYQSQLIQGFSFLTAAWNNNPTFPQGKNMPPPGPGYEPLLANLPVNFTGAGGLPPGTNFTGITKWFTGMDIATPSARLLMPTNFIQSRGGEFFFSPPISALSGVLAN